MVADEAAADELRSSLNDLKADVPFEDDLEISPGAPLPSGRVIIADTIFFEVASDQIEIDDKKLRAIVALAESRQDWILTVVGHTDDDGSNIFNLELSLRRAVAVRDLLIQQGLPNQNLRIRGAGETSPIADNDTSVGRAKNRRIEFEFRPKG